MVFLAYTYDDYRRDVDEVEKAYGDIVQGEVIGHSVQGRPLYKYTIGRGERTIHISGAHHAREWMTTWLVFQQLRFYSRLYEEDAVIGGQSIRGVLDTISLQFIPVVNPDGVILATEGWENSALPYENYKAMAEVNGIEDKYWLWKANIRGVDLNRQYPMNWALIRNSPSQPAAMNFKGAVCASEPEVIALLNDIIQNPPLVVIAYHSAGEEIYWYHGQVGAGKERDYTIAQQLSALTTYALIPEEEHIAGGFADWFVSAYNRPGFTIEVGLEPHPVDMEQRQAIWTQNKYVPLQLLRLLV